jgi:TPR repeat protein
VSNGDNGDRFELLCDQVYAMDPIAALAFLLPLAEAGDADAQCLLADQLDEGGPHERDPVQAVAWYRRAAAQGHDRAEYFLGSMLAHGIGAGQDFAEAAFWFRRGVAKGDPAAQFRLGELIARRRVVAAPGEGAAQLLQLAAAQGHAGALELLRELDG